MIDTYNNGMRGGSYQPLNAFEAVVIKVASPEKIHSWSYGEVRNPETINYRSLKPEKNGLFCEKIFGPTRDYECNCGKFKRGDEHARTNGQPIVCDRCGVEVTTSKVRRERMGHIDLAVPVSHIWFFKCLPSRIATMLDKTAKVLEKILYYESYVVTDPGDTPLTMGQELELTEYLQAKQDYGDSFTADTGAPAVYELLSKIDLPSEHANLEIAFMKTRNKQERKKISRRLRLIEGFMESDSRPEWMILKVLPVIPPDLRPLVPLDGGRYATSDLNDLYRRVINRNNRLKQLLNSPYDTPEVILLHEKRMLQEAVDSLMDNGRRGRAVTGQNASRNLKSLSDMLKGKQGRFRQNLLGKRVDYSGRSVIVVGPELHLNQCGIPKKMALVLFEPFIVRHLKNREDKPAKTVRAAKKMIERGEPEVWDILEEVTKGHPVMLNRAPTLHRLSIQAFDPILIEGSAIRLHPLVCTGYNADFDGDQMAVHVPLSPAAQLECKLLMSSVNNIFSPANGKPIATPTQDITLGVYYLTMDPHNPERARVFRDVFEVLFALDTGHIKIHDAVRIPNPDYGFSGTDEAGREIRPRGDKTSKFLLTTPGRCIFNRIWDPCLGFYNAMARKKEIAKLIAQAYAYVGHAKTIELLDNLKNLGYEYATVAGFSISIADMSVPKVKSELIRKAREEIQKITKQHENGVLTEGERYNKVVDVWTQTSNDVANALFNESDAANKIAVNPVYSMLDSGARGSKDQIRQLAGMRGLMAKPSGAIIERPILSNFREGLTVQEYFISTHGARKGLADTALKTADSGYMTRKLVDVAQDIICRCDDCGTMKGVWVSAIMEGDEEMLSLKDRLLGRFSAQDIRDPASDNGSLIVAAGQEFTPEIADKIKDRGITRVQIRSVLTCDVEHGVCVKCYGKNLATDKLAEVGDSLGIIAAQSIGEPGTQLTMRTFHIGGTASSAYKEPVIKARNAGTIMLDGIRTVQNEKGDVIVVNKNGSIVVFDNGKALEIEENNRKKAREEAETLGTYYNTEYDYWSDAVKEAEIDRYVTEIGAVLFKKDGEKVKKDEKIAEWDPYQMPIIADESDTGVVDLKDMIDTVTYNRSLRGGVEEITVQNHPEDLHPQIVIKKEESSDFSGMSLIETSKEINSHSLPAGAVLNVKKGDKVVPGMLLARVPRQQQKTKDITGGLPRVSELFDARTPREIAEIADIDGVVDFGKQIVKGSRMLIIRDPVTNSEVQHPIKASKHLLVTKGDYVKKGQKLTLGAIVPQKLLAICGPQELQRFLVNEVQTVYRAQGVEINDKHIEIIIRQMMQKIKILKQGTTKFLEGEEVDRYEFARENERVRSMGGEPAEGEAVLLGITKASLSTESFISSASFQDTTRILTEAATLGKRDVLRGFKENVITGHLIPAGTGSEKYRDLHAKLLGVQLDKSVNVLIDSGRAEDYSKSNVAELKTDDLTAVFGKSEDDMDGFDEDEVNADTGFDVPDSDDRDNDDYASGLMDTDFGDEDGDLEDGFGEDNFDDISDEEAYQEEFSDDERQ